MNVPNIVAPTARAHTEKYNAGRALFFRGKLPCNAATVRDLTDSYDLLPIEDQRMVDGWFDARDAVRDAWRAETQSTAGV